MVTDEISILSVKYKIPSPREGYVVREKLMEKLDGLLCKKVAVIKAGAGSGKTTLVSSYIKMRGLLNVKWITMDSSMNSVFIFWAYVINGLSEYIDGYNESLKECFQGNLQREMLEQILDASIDKLKGERDIFLVLDDFQYINEEYLLETINEFIRMMPDNVHLILISRDMPGISVGSIYMEGKLLLIDDEEMRMSSDECREFLTGTLKMSIESGQMDRIIEDANGWVGGAQLMAIALRMKNAGSIYFSADEHVVYDYIEKEIFDALSDEEKLFLKKTALLSYFNEEICSRYLPEYNFKHMMRIIMEKNLFVINIDQEKQEYRYHAIMREFLMSIDDKDEKCKRDLCIRGADVFFELQDYDECVRLLFEAEDYENLMEKLMMMPQNVVTFSYMLRVPMAEIVKNVNFAYQYFFCYYAAQDMEKCRMIYKYIKYNMKEDVTFKAFKHINLFFNIDWEFKDISIMTFEQIESMPLNRVTKAYLLIKDAYFLFLADKKDDAMKYLNVADEIYKKTKNIYIESFVLSEKTQILESYGELRQALRLYERMEQVIESTPTIKAYYYIGIAGLHIRQMRINEAEKELALAKEAIEKKSETINSAYMYTIAELYYVSGHPEKTEEIILSIGKDEIYDSVFFMSRLLCYPLYREKNRELSKHFIESYRNADKLLKNMDTEILYAEIIYELQNKSEGIEILDKVAAKARKVKNKLKIVECTLKKAHFLYDEGRDDKIIANLLIEAVSYAYPENIAVPFWYERKKILEILNHIGIDIYSLMSDAESRFLWSIVSEDGGAAKEDDMEMSSEYSLTNREMDVLREIADGYTNKDIAKRLCISVATVKTHLINIYGKLGVNNRMAAVNKMKVFKK